MQKIAPLNHVMEGEFYRQGMYEIGTVQKITADFDGDGAKEKVTFRFQQMRHWLTFEKNELGYEIDMNLDFVNCLTSASKIHIGVKDVTNDGIPELLIAADRGDAFAMLGVYGMKAGRFCELDVLQAQFRIYVDEGGHIVAPYGSVGLYWDYRWNGGQFEKLDKHDPLRRRSFL